jgi:hypothetical protein
MDIDRSTWWVIYLQVVSADCASGRFDDVSKPAEDVRHVLREMHDKVRHHRHHSLYWLNYPSSEFRILTWHVNAGLDGSIRISGRFLLNCGCRGVDTQPGMSRQ